MPHPTPAFDPATGNWLPPPDAKPAWDPEARKRDKWSGFWNAVLALDLLALAVMFGTELLAVLTSSGPAPVSGISAEGIAVSSVLNVFLMGVVPFLWVVATRAGGLHGAVHYLKLERFPQSLPWGVLLGFGIVGILVVIAYLLAGTDVPTENPVLEQIGSVMTLPLAILVAATAAWGEEILFRGVLQRWLGVWGQAAAFGIAHASYGTILQVVFPFLLGLLFGFLVKRGVRLWVPILAHFTFDLVMLLSLVYGW